ncbi:MAG TPA: carboxypeptidase regulatory-like domain-containing protein [Bryobacteraceae bacterium]|nr:carboxypeptidase regulatory-like domain-containing protein [Bryobacteraceae bacterium]
MWLAHAAAGPVGGSVEISNSQDPTVRRTRDYTGVVLWLEPVEHNAEPPAPPLVPKHERMIQKDKHFLPHVMAVPVGSTVDFPNLDPIYHNAFSNFSGQTFDTGLYKPGTSRSESFKVPGIMRIFCNIHPTMSAIIAVLPTPFYAVTDALGRFSIPAVPPGEYELRIFHERSLPDVLKFLERRITVPDGGLSLPLISISETGYIPAAHFNKYGKEYPPVANDSTYPGARK